MQLFSFRSKKFASLDVLQDTSIKSQFKEMKQLASLAVQIVKRDASQKSSIPLLQLRA
jgi:hypothetical protein